jgi:hypothetical protein
MKDFGWTISLDVDTAEPVDEDTVGMFLDELLEFGASVKGGGGSCGYGAIFSLRRVDLDAPHALARGIRIFREAAMRAELPVGELVWAEVMTFAEHDRRLASGQF